MQEVPSTEYPKFYLEQLYPLQDKFLSFLEGHHKGLFYLTGGTALSRIYAQHRFSDDLDFFSVREMTDFRERVADVINAAKKAGFSCETETVSDHFFRFFVKEKDVPLKIDFVNEMVFHWGELKKTNVFSLVDNEINILANKLTALTRYEAKDIADIWVLARRFAFSWREIIEIADKKSPVDPLECSKIIKSIPETELRKVKWQIEIKTEEILGDLQTIAQEILLGQPNSLSVIRKG